MASLVTWATAHAAVIFGVLFGLSEALAQIPSVKANNVFQLVFGWLQAKQSAASAAVPPAPGA